MNVSAWLSDLGLERYAKAFDNNDIDAVTLLGLTNEDLKELGVRSLGHRKKLLKAISALAVSKPAAVEQSSVAAVNTGRAANTHDAQRRQLTVMFCDLVGSTAISERLDPEDLRDLLWAYQKACAGAVARYDGNISRYIGDGLLINFGYPQAHEDDARRSVKAGIAIIAEIERFNERFRDSPVPELRVRIGIHTGLVVVGEMGAGETLEIDAVVGETPNIASMLQAVAEPNSVVISEATKRLVDGSFRLEDLGLQNGKGLQEPVRAYQVIEEIEALSRFEASIERDLAPLVGRKPELDFLQGRWAHARNTEAQTVLLAGEAGIGKSRVVSALREHLADEAYSYVHLSCSPYHGDSALYPVIRYLQRLLRLTGDDAPEQKLEKLRSTLATLQIKEPDAEALMVSLLSLVPMPQQETVKFTRERMKARMMDVLVRLFDVIAARAPVLFVVEDAQWIDPSTKELLTHALEQLVSTRILFLITHRPGFATTWRDRPNLSSLALNRLGRVDTVAMIVNVAHGKRLPEEVIDAIVDRTDGVPLYIEELTKSVLESDLLVEDEDAYRLDGALPLLAIPASLQDSLMARLDRLADVKEVAQLAATIGRTFTYELLSSASPLAAVELRTSLDALVASGLVYPLSHDREVTYQFKHALVRDAAYQSLLKSTRQHHHRLIASILQESPSETSDIQPEVLAHHLTQAGELKQALDLLQRAAEHSIERSANVEAVSQLRKAIELLPSIPEQMDREKTELDLLLALIGPLAAAKGYATPEREGLYARALHLADRVDADTQLFPILHGQFTFSIVSGHVSKCLELAEEFLRRAERTGSAELIMVGHRIFGTSRLLNGNFDVADTQLQRAAAMYDPHVHYDLAATYMQDIKVAALSWRAFSLWLLGCPDQAVAASTEAIAYAKKLAHANTLGFGLALGGGIFNALTQNVALARQFSEDAVEIASKRNLPAWSLCGKAALGWAMCEEGNISAGKAMIREYVRLAEAANQNLVLPFVLTLIADSLARSGEIDEAFFYLSKAEAVMDAGAERWAEAETHRVKGNLLLAKTADRKGEAEACYRRALTIADAQKSPSLALRAASSAARLRGEAGRRKEGHDILAPIYDRFSEGLETAELQHARNLLDQLV